MSLSTGNTAVVNLLTKQIPEGSTPVYTARLLQSTYFPVPSLPASLSSLTLTIIDTLTGIVINNCQNINILNTGRGTVDQNGIITITLLPGDTDMSEVPGATQIQRSLIINYTFGGGRVINSHRVNILIISTTN